LSISVSNITKIYGTQKALDNVSFEVKEGEITGFLGPNGAGKSTMMKIITCFIPPTDGSVKVCGLDIRDESIEVRKLLGYLPENNPLYLEMYVKEYLSFIAGIHKLDNKKKRVDEMIEMVGLELEQRKKIGTLSKGYKQRIGLAQAMIHDPKVLILDEPTSGLDPNQLEEIRKLIKKIGKEKTVMLSTHIMQEVEQMCDKVMIINRGKIVANSSASELQKDNGDKTIIVVEFDQKISDTQLLAIDVVSDAKNTSGNKWVISTTSKDDTRPIIAKFAQENKLLVLSMHTEEQKLEDVFKKLTKANG